MHMKMRLDNFLCTYGYAAVQVCPDRPLHYANRCTEDETNETFVYSGRKNKNCDVKQDMKFYRIYREKPSYAILRSHTRNKGGANVEDKSGQECGCGKDEGREYVPSTFA